MSENLNGAAIEQIATLAKSAVGFQVVKVDHDDNTLAPTVLLGFDPRGDGNGLVDLRPMLERWRVAPERCIGTATVTTLQSFIDLVNRHKSEDSVVFAKTAWPGPALTAVIDYHGLDHVPAFAKHRVQYAFPITDEFKAWADQDGKPMSQTEFAAFIEEHAPELASPMPEEVSEFGEGGLFKTAIATPAKLIELSRGLEINVGAKVKNAQTLQSGEGEIIFVEEHLNAKGEKLTVPGLFMVALPAFVDGGPVRIPARLRYRVREGSVVWFYQLFRWKQYLRDRVVADLEIVQAETVLPVYEGTPES
ncbi:MAG TPA: DUF2303 family protein [Xanthobacteraceae bacterium]|nr:DUF2303 family protein [Xanthobacteraceae bacterium]